MIYSNKVALFTDLHLGIYGNSEEWHDTALKWADWIVSDLLDRGIDTIFFLGDYFDNRSEISVQTMHIASKIIEKFSDFKMIMIVGNHDAYYKNRSDVNSLGLLKGNPNIVLVEKPWEFKAFNKNFLFVPWEGEIPDKKYDYVFGHFEITGFRMNNYTVCNDGMDAMDLLARKTGRVFSGHFHNRHSNNFNEGKITYIGSCFPMDFSDVDNTKGYHILDVTNGDVEFVENTVSPVFIRLHLKDLKGLDTSKITGNIVKLVVQKKVEDEKMEKLEYLLRQHKPWRLTVDYDIQEKTIDDIDDSEDGIELTEMFDKFYEQLEVEEDQLERVSDIINNLHEKNKV